MCTDLTRPVKKAAIPVIAAWVLAFGTGALADPVSIAPVAPVGTSKDEVTAAIRASEGSERSVADAFDADPVREAAATAKANADRRAALAALGIQSQQAQQRQAGQPSRLQGGGITESAPGPSSAMDKDAAHAATPQQPDALKEAVRPLYDEISKSGIADAMRSLKADLKAHLAGDKDKPAEGAAFTEGAPATAAKPKEGAPTTTAAANGADWGGAVGTEFRGPPKTAAQIERDRMLAAAGMEKLIADVQPWIIGLLVLTGVAFAWRMTLRYLRELEGRRRRRRVGPSTHPRRSQF